MASGINSGNYFANINSQLAAKGPDKAALETARNATGDTATTAKSHKHKEKGEGVQLSDKAMKSLQNQHTEHMQGHEHEMAEHAGLQEYEGDNAERQEIRKERNSEAYQHEVGEQDQQGGVRIQSKTGADQFLDPGQHERLTVMDDIDRHDPLADIPDANLRAADNVFAANASKGLGPVAHLKPVPESEAAANLEVAIAPPLAEPMGIREPGNDRTTQPMQLDLPPETERIAAEQAARQLQAGGGGALDEQMVVGMPGAASISTNGAAQAVKSGLDPLQSRELRGRRDEAKQYLDQTVTTYVENVEKLFKGRGEAVGKYIADTESKFAQELGQGGQPVDREVVRYAAIGQAAQDNLDLHAKNYPEAAQLLSRHTGPDGQLDMRGFCQEASQIAESYSRQGNKEAAFVAEDMACCATLVSASHQYLDSTQALAAAGEGPVKLANGKLDLTAAGSNPATQGTLERLKGLNEDQSWRERQANAEAMSTGYDQLKPEQQAELRTRVDSHVARLELGSDDDSSETRDKRKKPEVDRSMVWAEEMEQWSAACLPQAAPDQKALLQNMRAQAESYRLLRNVMDEKGWG